MKLLGRHEAEAASGEDVTSKRAKDCSRKVRRLHGAGLATLVGEAYAGVNASEAQVEHKAEFIVTKASKRRDVRRFI